MDYLGLLNDNTSKIFSKSKKIRDFISNIIDKDSFVETDLFMSGKSFIDGSDALGEGVITGYATINEYPICLIAQNAEVLGGSLGKTQADKILKTIKRSIDTNTPLISIIDSIGARLGEGMAVLEGYGEIIAAAAELKNYVPHIAILKGNAIGLMGMYTAMADFIFMTEKSVISALPPLTLANSASDAANKFLGTEAFTQNSLLTTITYKQDSELSNKIINIFSYLGDVAILSEDDPNRTSDILNVKISADNLLQALADDKSAIEMFSDYTTDIKTVLAMVNSIPVGIVVTNAEKLNAHSIKKAKKFIKLLDSYGLPLITLVDSKGVEGDLATEQQGLVLTCAKLIATISQTDIPKIAVITEYAIGYSYVALASKATGFDYVLAFANAKIAPIGSEMAASIIYSAELKGKGEPIQLREQLADKYRIEEMNPFVSAKDGYVDNVIEPALLRPYVASALTMLLR